MFNFLKSKLCCQSDQNDLTLLLELVHSKNYFTHEKSDSRSRFINNDYISSTLSTLDLQSYQVYVFLSFNCGFISKDQDFIYLSSDNSPKPSQENIDPSKMLEISVNPYNISSGHVSFGLQNVDLTKIYKVHYMRKNMRTGQLHTLYTTQKFKIALKNRIYNLFLDSVNDLTSQELAIIYENDPFFSKISCQKMSKTHRKNMSMIPLSTDGNSFSTSTKTGSSNGKSRFDENILHRIPKGSIFTTGSSIGGDVNIIHHSNPSYVHFNRDSFDSNNQQTALKHKKMSSIGNAQDMARCLFNDNYPSSGKDVGEFIATSQENEEANNETVIINENKENDEYIKKLCAVLNENLENAAYAGQDRESLVSPFVDYRSRMEPRVACPFKSIERVQNTDSSVKSSSEFSMRARRLIDFSGQSLGKESGEKKRKIFNSGDKDSFCEKGSPEFLISQQQQRFEVNLRTTADDECYIGFSVPNRKRGRDLFSGSWGSNSKLNKQERDENLEKKLLRSISGRKSDSRGSREFIPSGQSEPSEESVVILHSIPEEEEREEKMSKNVPLGNTENSQNQFELESEEDPQMLYITESPRESEGGFGTHHTPGYSERLYTVEEVCSASKESSKMMSSGPISSRNFRSSKKLNEKLFMRKSERVDEFGEWKSLDFENLSANVTQNSMREMSLEMMILKQKIEDLGGLKFEYLQKECLIQIHDRLNKEVKFTFRWYKETEENDLSSYFDEIFQSVKAYVSHQRRGRA